MTGSFQLVLDTHAPRLTWGAVTGGDPGSSLQVAYTLDEPAVESAELQLVDRTLPVVAGALYLSVDIPDDAPEGNATLSAVATDDVGNSRTYTLVVNLGGVIAPPPPTPGFPSTGGGMPRGPMEPVRRVLPPGGGRVRSEDQIIVAAVAEDSTLAVRAVYRLPDRAVAADRSTLHTRSRISLSMRSPAYSSTAVTRQPADKIQRRDGPETEAAFVLLDLL